MNRWSYSPLNKQDEYYIAEAEDALAAAKTGGTIYASGWAFIQNASDFGNVLFEYPVAARKMIIQRQQLDRCGKILTYSIDCKKDVVLTCNFLVGSFSLL